MTKREGPTPKAEARDVFSGAVLCYHKDCQWQTGQGTSGIEAKYRDKRGRPCCFEHRQGA